MSEEKKGIKRLDTTSTDASHWAECFCEQTGYDDQGMLLGWFANYWAAVHDPIKTELESTKAELAELRTQKYELKGELSQLKQGVCGECSWNSRTLCARTREQLQAELNAANEKLRWHPISGTEPETALLFIADSNDWSSIEQFWFDDDETSGFPVWADCWMYAEGIVPKDGVVPSEVSDT